MKPYHLGPFLGVNNRLPDFALRVPKEGDFLAAAENVDIDNAGRIRSAPGFAILEEMTEPHSLKMIDASAGYMVRDSVLYSVTLPTYAETAVKTLTNNDPMRYAKIFGDWYFSNGTDVGRLSGAAEFPIGLPTPAAPSLATIVGGLLTGKYLVATSYCRKSGSTLLEEGGISPYASAELVATGGLRVTLPGTATGATHVNIYLSACNGSLPYLLATVPATDVTYDAVSLPQGREASGRIEAPLPAGTLFEHMGRLCSFSGASIYVGIPHRPGYYLPASGRLNFPATISIVVSAQTGIYVAADKTYWIPGDIGDIQGQVVDVLPYGAVPGTEFSFPDNSRVGWFGAEGVVIADTTGQAQPAMADNVAVTPPPSGFSTVLESDGYKRVISCGWCLNLENNAATAYVGWDFSSVSEGYGTLPDGIYQIGGDGPVACMWDYGRLDFGSDELKYLPYAYARFGSPSLLEMTVSYTDDNDEWREYSVPSRGSSEVMREQRFDLARGTRSTLYGIVVRNTDGARFVQSGAYFMPKHSNRRI